MIRAHLQHGRLIEHEPSEQRGLGCTALEVTDDFGGRLATVILHDTAGGQPTNYDNIRALKLDLLHLQIDCRNSLGIDDEI